MPASIQTTSEVASRKGMEYEAANRATIPSDDEQMFDAFTDKGRGKNIVVQVWDVNQSF